MAETECREANENEKTDRRWRELESNEMQRGENEALAAYFRLFPKLIRTE